MTAGNENNGDASRQDQPKTEASSSQDPRATRASRKSNAKKAVSESQQEGASGVEQPRQEEDSSGRELGVMRRSRLTSRKKSEIQEGEEQEEEGEEPEEGRELRGMRRSRKSSNRKSGGQEAAGLQDGESSGPEPRATRRPRHQSKQKEDGSQNIHDDQMSEDSMEIEPGALAIREEDGQGVMHESDVSSSHDSRVTLGSTPVAAEVVLDEEAQQEKLLRNILKDAVAAEVVEQSGRWRLICCIATMAILLGVLLGVLIPRKNDKGSVDEPEDPISDYDFLVNLLSPVSGEELLLDESSPQYQALDWLAFEGNATYAIQNVTTSILLERYIMAVLYFTTDGQNWNSDYNFLSNFSACEWPSPIEENERETTPGVRCDVEGNIVKIFLGKNNLNGTIPTELGALESLQYLNVFGNSLNGTIPSAMGDLWNLNKLFLQKNDLTGPIPDSLAQLSRLTVLNLNNQDLTGTIPSGVTKIPTLEWLFLDVNSLTGTIPEFGSNLGIERIDLAGNALEGTIPESMYTLGRLEKLSTWGNTLTGTISSGIRALTNLQELYLDGNAFHGTLPTEIGLMTSLAFFWANYNAFDGPIPSELGNLRDMQYLVLHTNRFSGTIPSELGLLTSLSFAAMNNNSITGHVMGSSSICSSDAFANFYADCAGDVPEVTCDCCTTCCDDMTGTCVAEVDQVCKNDARQFELESRGTVCECLNVATSGNNETSSCSGDETFCPLVSQSCNETCVSCNVDGTLCGVTLDYGWQFDALGSRIRYTSEFQYTLGRDEMIFFEMALPGAGASANTYSVSINGQPCSNIAYSLCPDGSDAWIIDCENVQEGASIDACETLDAGGPLEVFASSFDQSDCRPPLSRCYFFQNDCIY